MEVVYINMKYVEIILTTSVSNNLDNPPFYLETVFPCKKLLVYFISTVIL